MNFEAAEKGIKFLESEPRRFDMAIWMQAARNADLLEDAPPCGTACCFAGAVVAAHDGMDKAKHEHIRTRAMLILGISEDQSQLLFYRSVWPKEFANRYGNARTQKGRVRALREFVSSLKRKRTWKSNPMSAHRSQFTTSDDERPVTLRDVLVWFALASVLWLAFGLFVAWVRGL